MNRMTVEEDCGATAGSVRSAEFGVRSESPDPQSPAEAARSGILSSPLRDVFLTAPRPLQRRRIDAPGTVIGDPTETALLTAAARNGYDKKTP